MPLLCEKCQGAGVRAGEMRQFHHDGTEVRCLAFVSNCMVCGHRWEDPLYEEENAVLVTAACNAALDHQNALET